MRAKFTLWFYKKKLKIKKKKNSTYLYNLSKMIYDLPRELEIHYTRARGNMQHVSFTVSKPLLMLSWQKKTVEALRSLLMMQSSSLGRVLLTEYDVRGGFQ